MSKKISVIGSQITLTVSVSLVLLIIGILMSTMVITSGANDKMRRQIALTVRVDKNASESDLNSLDNLFAHAVYADSYRFYTSDDVLKQELAYNRDVLAALDENPYNAEYEVTLNPLYVNSDSLQMIQQRLELLNSVDEVYTQADIVDNVNSILNKLNLMLSIVALVLVIISIVLIFNSVNIAVYTRRFTIDTMRLVGATPAFIRRPYIKAGVITGAVSGAVASAILCGIVAYANTTDLNQILGLRWLETGLVCLALIVLGIVFCGTASCIAATRILRMPSEELYR